MQIQIEKFLNNGYGLARMPDGAIVFVKNALPGETVDLDDQTLTRKKGVFWAETFQLEMPSVSRTQPDCLHGRDCGGCATLHIRSEDELALKAQAISDNLKRLAQWKGVELECYDFPRDASRYRGKFHANGTFLGWKKAGSNQLIRIGECRVLPKSLQNILSPLQERIAKISFSGEIYFAVHPETQQVLLGFQGTARDPKALATLCQQEGIAGISFSGAKGNARLNWGKKFLNVSWPPFQVAVEASQFFQSNPKSWATFQNLLRDYLETHQPVKIWDVHAGSGFLTSGLCGHQVVATEPDKKAFAQLRSNLNRLGWSHMAFNQSAETAISQAVFDWSDLHGAILDPPRIGLSKPFREWCIHSGPPSMLYFSCDLGTFSRDLAALGRAYQPVGKLRVLNVNPGTLRAEYAVILVRQPKSP